MRLPSSFCVAVPLTAVSGAVLCCACPQRDWVELTHSLVTCMWVTANVMWGATELFVGEYPAPMDALPSPLTNGRWYAAWLLVAAAFPVITLYALWIPATVHGTAPELKTLIKAGAAHSAPPPPPPSTGSLCGL